MVDDSLANEVLAAERESLRESGGHPANRRAFARVGALLGALLEAQPMNARDLGTLLMDVDGNLTLDLLPRGTGTRIVVVDISAGGMKGAASVPVPDVGKSVVVRIFSASGQEPIPVLAEVAWTRPLHAQGMTAFGLRFVGISAPHRKRIEELTGGPDATSAR